MRDLDGLLALIGDIYEAGTNASRWPIVLEHVSTALNGASTSIAYHDGTTYQEYYGARLVPEALAAYASHFCSLDPVLPSIVRRPAGVYTDTMITEKNTLIRSEFYNEFARPYDMHSNLGAVTFQHEGCLGLLACARSIQAGEFATDDVEAVGLLLPHLGRAMRLHLALKMHGSAASAGTAALDCVPQPVLLLDHQARVLFANSAAEAMLRARDGLGTDADGITAATRAETAALRRQVAIAAGAGGASPSGGSLQLTRPSGRRALSILATPLRQAALPAWMPVSHPSVMLVVGTEPTDDPPATAPLQELYGLTPAEASLAAQIARGVGVQAAAAALGIAPSTARTHLSRVFAKTGTGRQAELAALLAGLAARADP